MATLDHEKLDIYQHAFAFVRRGAHGEGGPGAALARFSGPPADPSRPFEVLEASRAYGMVML